MQSSSPPPVARPAPSARLVVVDDSADYRMLLTFVLSRDKRFEVVAEAADGRQGLAAVADHAPDLVVTDLQMPEIDGIELTRTLRRQHQDLPIVMVTGVPDDDVMVEAEKAGVTAFLAKTGSTSRLLATLHAVLDGRLERAG